MVVLHYTAMAGAEAALERLCDPVAEVSAHWLVGRCGQVWRMVDEDLRAWHAGAGAWGAVGDVNSRSIGIEIDNDGRAPFAEPAMVALERLLAGVMARWEIRPERVIGHQDMAPERKIDPGPRFDWRRLALAGLSVWPEGMGADRPFAQSARAFGYVGGGGDAVLAAFRARFRPGATGPQDAQDRRLMAALAARWPVDRAGPGA
jgi:N-acetylmuramoyl-L-alanine amidase